MLFVVLNRMHGGIFVLIAFTEPKIWTCKVINHEWFRLIGICREINAQNITKFAQFYTRFQNYATEDENARDDMSVLCHSVTKFKLWVLRFLVDVYALYALYKQAYSDFQDILVRIIAKFKHKQNHKITVIV